VITDTFWDALMEVVDAPDIDTEENKAQPGRWKNRDLINRRLNEMFSTNTQKYWLELLRSKRIPCAPVNNLAQALSEPQVISRNMVIEVDHPLGGSTKMPGNPIKLSDTYEDCYTPPPLLGQHNKEIYQILLGKSDEELEFLRAKCVI
jgi:crotonobetainyl-CoA:carnitine CoA-transferase CaiB-like acyl-CoA transferase